MTMATETEIKETEIEGTGGKYEPGSQVRVAFSKIRTPDIVPEQHKISGFVFSERFLKEAGLKEPKIPKTDADWIELAKYSELAEKIESDSAGGPTVGSNYIKIWIDNEHPNAGSSANYIWMYFGRSHRIKLWGIDKTKFPRGWIIQWNLNQNSAYLESIPTDRWDEIHLRSPSGDGIRINRVRIVHSSIVILDWSCKLWLDNSKLEKHGRVGLAAKILSKKLGWVGNIWVPQIHWAARELGKSDGSKYGTGGAWCSEFASWCLRKALWGTPTGSIGSSHMESYFKNLGRKYTKNQVLNKDYVLNCGDYLRMFDCTHSGLFIRYVDSSASPTIKTRIKTIEGNTSSTVNVKTRKLGDLDSVGNTR
jgi:hypothetical protein